MDAGRLRELEAEVAHLAHLVETVGTLAVMALEGQGIVVPDDETFDHLVLRLNDERARPVEAGEVSTAERQTEVPR